MVCEQREARLMAQWVPAFAAIDDPSKTYAIDAFSPLVQIPAFPEAQVSIFTVRSTKWLPIYRANCPYVVGRSEWASGIRRDRAATKIQRAWNTWRAATASPFTAVGKKRLLDEFASLAEETDAVIIRKKIT